MKGLAWLIMLAANAQADQGGLPNVLARLKSGQETRIVCFGDSITGVYYHTGSRIAYPELVEKGLRHLFPKTPVRVINAGLSGNTTTAGLARMGKDVLDHKPHLVVVMYGMNDLAGTPVEQFTKNLRTIISRARGAGAEVLLCTQNNIFPTDSRRPPERLAQFSQAIRDVASETNAPLADCYVEYERIRETDPRRWAVLLMGHDIHPSLDGHRVFAQLIVEQIAGRKLPLSVFSNTSPSIPRTLGKLRAGEPVKVTLVGLDAHMVGDAIKAAFPNAKVIVDERAVGDPSMPSLAKQEAKLFASTDDDLLVIGMPRQSTPLAEEEWMHCMFQVTYKSVPFSKQHRPREVVWVLPSVISVEVTPTEREHDQLLRDRAHAGDLGAIWRGEDDKRPAVEVMTAWLKNQNALK